MPDDRPIEEKIKAVLAVGSGATEGERAAASAALLRLQRVPAPGTKAGRVLTRDSVKAQSDANSSGLTVRVRYPSGTWYVLDYEDADWDTIKELDLVWFYID